jgi:hypothetical protein
MIDRNEDGRSTEGPGCFGSLILLAYVCVITAMVTIDEARLQRIENKLGLPNCGAFNSATWDGKTCRGIKK